MKENQYPEERLLRLIRGQKKAPSAPVSPAPPSAGLPATQPAAPRRHELFRYMRSIRPTTVLWVAAGGSLWYVLAALVAPLVMPRPETVTSSVRLSAPASEAAKLPPDTTPLEFYLQEVNRKTIFGSRATAAAARPAAVADSQAIKDMNLIGIIAGPQPQAAIEDKKAQKTFYVYKGQSLGEFQVEDIQDGKVILLYNGQRYELYL